MYCRSTSGVLMSMYFTLLSAGQIIKFNCLVLYTLKYALSKERRQLLLLLIVVLHPGLLIMLCTWLTVDDVLQLMTWHSGLLLRRASWRWVMKCLVGVAASKGLLLLRVLHLIDKHNLLFSLWLRSGCHGDRGIWWRGSGCYCEVVSKNQWFKDMAFTSCSGQSQYDVMWCDIRVICQCRAGLQPVWSRTIEKQDVSFFVLVQQKLLEDGVSILKVL